jgi:formamidopyrimidine-DNA glycosylase
VRRIHRRGKYLILEMEPLSYCLVHFGMTGSLSYHAKAAEIAAHTHARIRFSDSTELHYRDHRRFGLLAAYEVSRLGQIPELKLLGMDPLSSRINIDRFWHLLQRSRQEIKSFVLDQQKIAGVGNIYASEALYHARVHPARRCSTLTREDAARLVRGIRTALRAGLRHNGTTFSDFMGADGEPGANQRYLRVFQREGERCRRCLSPISRLRQGNRSTFFCPHCQR